MVVPAICSVVALDMILLIGGWGIYQEWIQDWLADRIMRSRQPYLTTGGIVIGLTLLVVLLSNVALYRIMNQFSQLERALATANFRRVDELRQLIIGLAHEIRNPLNVIQLNLFTTRRVVCGTAHLEHDEMITVLQESLREIGRIDHLIALLLEYARADQAGTVRINLVSEIESVTHGMRSSMQTEEVQILVKVPSNPVYIRSGEGHVCQILNNLLSNAREAVSRGTGQIVVELQVREGSANFSITDNGPGIPEDQQQHLFEPFFTTKEQGVGLGLAISRSLVEIGGGSISYVAVSGGGSSFRVQWPLASHDRLKAEQLPE